MTSPAAISPGKLPLIPTVTRAYGLTWENLGALGTVAAVWGPMVFVVLFEVNWLVWPMMQASATAGSMSIAIALVVFCSVSIGATAAVAWHRNILLGEKVSAGQVARYDRRTWRYAGWVLSLVLVAGLPIIGLLVGVAAFTPNAPEPSPTQDPATAGETADPEDPFGFVATLTISAVLAVLMLPFSFPAMRLLPILPAIAIEGRNTAGAAWRATRGNFWRLLIGTLATTLPAIAFSFVGIEFEGRLASSLFQAIYEVVWLVTGLVFVTFMSLAYRHFFPAPPAAEHPP